MWHINYVGQNFIERKDAAVAWLFEDKNIILDFLLVWNELKWFLMLKVADPGREHEPKL